VDAYKYAGYLQFKYHPFARLTLHGGVRYDYFDYTENGYFAPRGGLSFHLSPITDLNFAYGRHYQSPDFSELTRHPANKHLESKYTEQYIAGIEHLFAEDFKATLEAYWKKYDDVPVRYSMTTKEPNDFDDGVYVNEGSGTAKGIELFLQKKLSQNFYGTLSYSYSISEADDPRYPGETYDWDFDYRHVFTLITGYKIKFDEKEWYRDLREKTWYKWTAWLLPFAEEVQIGMKWRYLGGRPYTPPIYHPEHKTWQLDPEQNINSDRLPAYHRLDFRWDRRFFFDTWNLVTFIEIENVYGQDNIWNYSYKDDGTKEEIYQYQTMPVGGLIIEF
jgi:outer membrane receptor for ferrienterochelin and colicin